MKAAIFPVAVVVVLLGFIWAAGDRACDRVNIYSDPLSSTLVAASMLFLPLWGCVHWAASEIHKGWDRWHVTLLVAASLVLAVALFATSPISGGRCA